MLSAKFWPFCLGCNMLKFVNFTWQCISSVDDFYVINISQMSKIYRPDRWLSDDAISGCSTTTNMGLLPDTKNCGLLMRRECRERFPRHRDPDKHHGTCVMYVPWWITGSLTCGFVWSRWRGKRSRHSQRMWNPQFYVSGKRPIPIGVIFAINTWLGSACVHLVWVCYAYPVWGQPRGSTFRRVDQGASRTQKTTHL